MHVSKLWFSHFRMKSESPGKLVTTQIDVFWPLPGSDLVGLALEPSHVLTISPVRLMLMLMLLVWGASLENQVLNIHFL